MINKHGFELSRRGMKAIKALQALKVSDKDISKRLAECRNRFMIDEDAEDALCNMALDLVVKTFGN